MMGNHVICACKKYLWNSSAKNVTFKILYLGFNIFFVYNKAEFFIFFRKYPQRQHVNCGDCKLDVTTIYEI